MNKIDFWEDIYCKDDVKYKISNLNKIEDDISRNVETIIFNQMFKIINNLQDYLYNIDNYSFHFTEKELNYINYRINNVKIPLIKSIYTFFRYRSTNNNKDLNSSINYINNELEYILDSINFDNNISKINFISNIFIPYLIFLHEYVLRVDYKNTKKFNKIFKYLLYNNQIRYEDSVKIIDTLFNRDTLDKTFIDEILYKLEENFEENRLYLEKLKLCRYISNKRENNKDIQKYNQKISDLYIKFADSKTGIVKNILIKKAIKYDSSKETFFQKNRENYDLNQVSDKIEITEDYFMPYCIESFDFYKLIEIITNLKLHFKTKTGDPLIDDCTINYIDENNNITDEDYNPALLETKKEIICYHAELIWQLLNFGHLYYKEISNYLNNSWFDKEILDNIQVPLEIFFKGNKSELEIRCAISTFIPQFEKIFRKLAIKSKIINENETIENSKMSILIKNYKIRELLGEDIHDYLNYVFFNFNLGLNLRNKFIHSTTDNIFTEQNLNILFICLIKLSNI